MLCTSLCNQYITITTPVLTHIYTCWISINAKCNMASLAWGPLWDPPGGAREGRCEARGEMRVAWFRNAVFGSRGLSCLWSKRALTPSAHRESGVDKKLWWVSLPPCLSSADCFFQWLIQDTSLLRICYGSLNCPIRVWASKDRCVSSSYPSAVKWVTADAAYSLRHVILCKLLNFLQHKIALHIKCYWRSSW